MFNYENTIGLFISVLILRIFSNIVVCTFLAIKYTKYIACFYTVHYNCVIVWRFGSNSLFMQYWKKMVLFEKAMFKDYSFKYTMKIFVLLNLSFSLNVLTDKVIKTVLQDKISSM